MAWYNQLDNIVAQHRRQSVPEAAMGVEGIAEQRHIGTESDGDRHGRS